MAQRLLSMSIFVLSGIIGLVAFLHPLLTFAIRGVEPGASAGGEHGFALTWLIIALTIGALLLEVQGERASAKVVAALGVLVAATSILRFLEVAIPGPGGFSPIFVPIILAGYVFGPRFGFLMGTLTIFVSALLTGGIGPWLPYQMFATGWVGLTAGLLPQLEKSVYQLTMLAAFAFFWGLLYGAIMNLYFWPFLGAGVATAATGGSPLETTLRAYGAYYLTTSLVWDATRAAGNVALMLVLGLPAVSALARFRDRFHFQVLAQ